MVSTTIPKKNSIFLFDVNHTLINTASYHTQALPIIENYLAGYIDKKAAKYIVKRFDEIFLLMVAGFLYRTAEEWEKVKGGEKSYHDLVYLISEYQTDVAKKWGFIKKWSREVFLKIAADEIRIHLPTDLISNTATLYWDSITSFTEPFDDAKELLSYIHKKGYPIYLLTSSDGRLQIKNGYFEYDPVFSGEYKKKRMKTLKEKNLYFRDIIVGDPEDKPLPAYFKRAVKLIEKDLGQSVRPETLIMVGNSFEDDLEIPLRELKFGKGILVDRDAQRQDNQLFHTVSTLLEIKDILDLD